MARPRGGQGGTVVLIAATLFVGYLFLTRRLQRVLAVLTAPAGAAATPSPSQPASGPARRGPEASPPVLPRPPAGVDWQQVQPPQRSYQDVVGVGGFYV